MQRFRALVVALLVCLASTSILGQAPGTGLYPFGSFDNRGFDSINLGNLNAHFEIPIVNKPGRGQGFRYTVVYDGMLWAPVEVSGTTYWQPDSGWGFHGQVNDGFAGYVGYHTQTFKCFADPPNWYWSTSTSNYIYYDSFGQQHNFNYATDECQSTTTGDGSTSDGSGYQYVGYVQNRYGSQIHVPFNNPSGLGNITDTNGNIVSNNGDGTFTDTLGVTALAISGGGSASSPRIFTYKVANQADSSTTAATTMSYVTYTVQTNFGCSGVVDYGPQTIDLIDRITLADGTYYHFTYETTPGVTGAVTGRLASVALPTGGTVSYSYAGGCNGNGINPDGTLGILNRIADGTRTYTRASINSNATSTTVQDEAGNQSLYQFTFVGGQFYETHRQAYQGAISGTPLLDQTTCYNGPSSGCDGALIALPVTETVKTTNKNGIGGLKDVSVYLNNGLLDQEQLWSAGGAWYKTTYYAYNSLGEPTNVHTNVPGASSLSNVDYGYDETGVTTTSGIPQHTSGATTRGNLTSIHAKIDSSGATLDKTIAYYDTGVPVSSTDPNGTTNYTYDATQGFATQVTPPTPSSGVSIPSYASYDANSGIQLSSSDANFPSTPQVSYANYDKLLRPAKITTADGGSVTINQLSANDQQILTKLDGSTTAETRKLTDGYGRQSRTAVFNGQSPHAWYQTDYCYDAVGNLAYVSTPYQGDGFVTTKVCSGSGSGTQYVYDALGRLTSTASADGPSSTQYWGNAVGTSDVNGKQTITQMDVLGRISSVCEESGTALHGDSPANCGADIAGSGFSTTYSYDLPSYTTTIAQGLQQRIFQTDWLGRPISIQEPESGTTTYSYSYNGTGLQVTRIKPRANQTGSLKTNTTTQYDKLGRVVSITYNDGTPNKQFDYDQATAWGNTTYNLGPSKGHLTDMIENPPTNWVAGAFLAYDSMGRVATTAQCLPSGCGNGALDKYLSYTYDLAGNLKSASDGAGVTTSYNYSAASEITSITSSVSNATNPSSLVSNVQNGPNGPLTWSLGNGLSGYQNYDWTGRRFETRVCGGTPSPTCSPQPYGVNAYRTGTRVTWVDDNLAAAGTSYGYDEFGRLKTTTINPWAGGQQTYSYDYDRYGNRWSQTPGPNPSADMTTNHALGFSYDAAGNMANDANNSYLYDADGNVIQATNLSGTTHYYYNALNQRVRVERGSAATEYIYNLSGQRVSIWDGNSHAQIQGQYYWGSQPVAYYGGGSVHFQHQDWLGTERVRTSYNGSVEGTYQSLPFGDGFSASISDGDPYHFAQLDHDSETDTHHAQFRNYSSTLGRWLSPDPYAGSYDVSDPQSFNRYVYARNNPLGVIDPSGLSGVCVSSFRYYTSEDGSAAGVAYNINYFVNNSFDCASTYGTWVETGSDVTMDVSSTDSVASPGTGAVAVSPSSSSSSGTGGGTVVGGGNVAPQNGMAVPILPPGMNAAAQAAKAAARGRPSVTPRNIPNNPPGPAPGYPPADEPPGPGLGRYMYYLMQILRIMDNNLNPMLPIIVTPPNPFPSTCADPKTCKV